uniref:SLAM family member 9 n=1 Tax=Xenopus tropicalis TaxID=8364 RepID=A0A803JRK1_XENTR
MRPLIPLLSALLISLPLLGTEDPVVHLNKLINDNATFHHGFELRDKTVCQIIISQDGPMEVAEYRKNGIEVAEYRNNGFHVTNDRYKQRIQFFNSKLMIQNLTLEDSGMYNISCWYPNAPKKKTSFNVTVYEPVQKPDIKRECQCENLDCNCTLRCLDPTNSSSTHWVILEDSKPVKNLNKSTIRTLLGDTSISTEYVCVLQNPADQKNASIGYWQLCSDSSHSCILCLYWWIWRVGLSMTLFIGFIFLILFIRKKVSCQNEAKYIPGDVELKVLGN